MRSLKIYVAAKFEEHVRVRFFQNNLLDEGHRIVCDWAAHAMAHPDYFKEKPMGVDRQFIAMAELSGVQRCDVLCLFPHPEGASAYAEATGALLLGKTVIAISETGLQPTDRTFLHHPDIIWVQNDAHALLVISGLARGH